MEETAAGGGVRMENGRLFRPDRYGYEGLAEALVSRLLLRSNIETDTPFRFLRCRMERAGEEDDVRVGCSSADFLQEGQSLVTLKELYARDGVDLRDLLNSLPSQRKRLARLACETAERTGLDLFPQYLTLLFEVDALFLNDDRHLNHIAVLEKDGRFDYCPVAGFRAALLANLITAPLDFRTEDLIRSSRPRPFRMTYNQQISCARSLFGAQLVMPELTKHDLYWELGPPLSYYPRGYHPYISERVFKTILTRQRAGSRNME